MIKKYPGFDFPGKIFQKISDFFLLSFKIKFLMSNPTTNP